MRKRRSRIGRWLVEVVVSAAAFGAVAEAHHSIAGMYDQGRRVTVDGTIAQFQFVNPHPFVLVETKDASGAAQSWKAKLDNRWELERFDVGSD